MLANSNHTAPLERMDSTVNHLICLILRSAFCFTQPRSRIRALVPRRNILTRIGDHVVLLVTLFLVRYSVYNALYLLEWTRASCYFHGSVSVLLMALTNMKETEFEHTGMFSYKICADPGFNLRTQEHSSYIVETFLRQAQHGLLVKLAWSQVNDGSSLLLTIWSTYSSPHDISPCSTTSQFDFSPPGHATERKRLPNPPANEMNNSR
ncbi:unnamed protein product [Timema podura]|uniref:Vomeronasal type-1 receptor n=1 Tax=Timema podura TaxID=61482 RepID=A0ABN7NTI8_TIMPD|nr:unnamed protein product [Timema podura]